MGASSEGMFLGIDDHIQLSLSECHPIFKNRSAPLFAVDSRDRPELIATCVAISYGRRAFLLTAAHAIYDIRQLGSSVYVGGEEIQLVPSEFHLSSPDGNDPFDIAAAEVPSEFILDNGIEMVGESETTAGRNFSSPHLHCMHGYPATKNKPIKSVNVARKTVTTYGFSYAGTLVKEPDFRMEGRSAATHVALSYQLGKNDEGTKVNPPKPQGMSGGGLWVVPESFNPSYVLLGGILIEHRNGVVLATKMGPVSEFLSQMLNK